MLYGSISAGRLTKKIAVCASLLTLFVLLNATSAIAQESGGCGANVSSSIDRGLMRIVVASPCRRNETVRVVYGAWEKQSVFSAEGVAKFEFVAIDDKNPVIIAYQDGTFSPEISVNTSSLGSVLRITVEWDQPVDLDLHVVEPAGALGGKGDAYAKRPASALATIGQLDLTDDGSGVRPFQESYVISNPPESARELFRIYLENVTRGRIPS